MNISHYEFHDGSVIDIKQSENKIGISMESAEVCEEDLDNNILLSDHRTIKGILHLDGIVNILDNGQPFTGILKMLHDSAYILRFDIVENKVTLFIEWVNFPPHPKVNDYSFFEIEAETIWWENIPDLFDPFW